MKTRREFILSLPLFMMGCSLFSNKISEEEIKRLQEEAKKEQLMDKNLISVQNPEAVALEYTENGDTPEALANKSSAKGAHPKLQSCGTCQNYKMIGSVFGSCQKLTQGNVSITGWCKSWEPKQGIVFPTLTDET